MRRPDSTYGGRVNIRYSAVASGGDVVVVVCPPRIRRTRRGYYGKKTKIETGPIAFNARAGNRSKRAVQKGKRARLSWAAGRAKFRERCSRSIRVVAKKQKNNERAVCATSMARVYRARYGPIHERVRLYIRRLFRRTPAYNGHDDRIVCVCARTCVLIQYTRAYNT